jgi:hypothetical protein
MLVGRCNFLQKPAGTPTAISKPCENLYPKIPYVRCGPWLGGASQLCELISFVRAYDAREPGKAEWQTRARTGERSDGGEARDLGRQSVADQTISIWRRP